MGKPLTSRIPIPIRAAGLVLWSVGKFVLIVAAIIAVIMGFAIGVQYLINHAGIVGLIIQNLLFAIVAFITIAAVGAVLWELWKDAVDKVKACDRHREYGED